MQEVSIVLTREDLLRLAAPFGSLMNEMQNFDGEKINEVVAAGLYAMGCALAQTGTYINVEAPVKEVLSALSLGYTEAQAQIRRRLI